MNIDDISIRSSQDSSDNLGSVVSRKDAKNLSKKKKPEAVELDLPSDGASTFRDFIPRDVKILEKQIN